MKFIFEFLYSFGPTHVRKIETEMNANRKLYALYRMVTLPLPMTLNDPTTVTTLKLPTPPIFYIWVAFSWAKTVGLLFRAKFDPDRWDPVGTGTSTKCGSNPGFQRHFARSDDTLSEKGWYYTFREILTDRHNSFTVKLSGKSTIKSYLKKCVTILRWEIFVFKNAVNEAICRVKLKHSKMVKSCRVRLW